MKQSNPLSTLPRVDAFFPLILLGIIGVASGVASLLWLAHRPARRSWAPVALVMTVGSITLLGFVLLPPLALWLAMGAP